ncbi:MAG: hypothetical protein ABJF10_06125 [Chthoniobacter sp.]|uniref:hypothetical protein n=1 Tax=Chthoniobacter sp. TaxID=2510640 RepID=UPI0032ADDA0E
MRTSFRTTALAVFALTLVQSAPANLVQDGNFTSVTYSGAPALSAPYFGQFGTGTGSTLTVANWTTAGYNFVYSATNVDQGTQASGANAGQPNQAPGQFNTGAGYGNTYMWGSHNGGASTWTAPPGGGNFIAADGAFEQGALTQVITGLTVGQTYALKFYYGGAQQQGTFTTATTSQWTVSMGTGNVAGNFTTPVVNNPAESFSGWFQQTFYFYANNTTETLSFLASGTPNGQPPFALLAGVDLQVVPEFSSWMVFAGFGAVCIGFEMVRRRRRRSEFAPAA